MSDSVPDETTICRFRNKVDAGSELIRKLGITPAHVHDSQIFEELVVGDEHVVYADKGYSGEERKGKNFIKKPRYLSGCYHLLYLYEITEKWTLAEGILEELINILPLERKFVKDFLLIISGDLFYYQGRFKEAEKKYQEAIHP